MTRRSGVGHKAIPRIESVVRLGYVVRGLLYLLPGIFALRLAIGPHGAVIAPTGAIKLIGHQPFGRILLFLVAAGLAGYALWGLMRAVYDPLLRGNSLSGVANRLGYLVSALGHAGLTVVALRYLAGTEPPSNPAQGWIAFVLTEPFGRWVLGIVGVCWILGAGLAQIVAGWRASFKRDFAVDRMSPAERALAILLGRVGFVVRGIVFTIVGALLVAAALHANSDDLQGMEGALVKLLHEPYGHWLLAFAGSGIIAFGLFSMMCARWMRIRSAAAGRPPHSSRSQS
jgi:hypothetical protein